MPAPIRCRATTMARKRTGRRIDGWLVLDKPSGMTSTAAVAAVKRLTGAAKLGHAGTLDPLATGVLPIAFGEATKTVAYAMAAAKRYRFGVRWGEARDTDDADGAVTETSDARPAEADILRVLPEFTGTISQVPPAYSAIKIDGRRAYELARKDLKPVLEAREIRVDRIALCAAPDRDHADFEVECGKGAYMRGLARDIALRLGTVGYVSWLRRIVVGPFSEGDAISLEQLGGLGHSAARFEAHLLSVAAALDDIPALVLTEIEADRLRCGRAVQVLRTADRTRIGELGDGAIICAMTGGKPIALTRVDGLEIRPVRVLHL